MNALETDLWSRIEGYAFDEVDAALPFSARLARDNKWPLNFAKRAIEEYTKFVFLATTAGHPVTPSDEVDQVWHLHLLYTHAYWDDFCKILGEPLHHGPTQGGTDEGRKFNAWYEKTLCSYAQVFASAPPADIWPEPARRFGDAAHFRRINTRTYWAIRKQRLPRPVWAAVVTAPLLWLSGCGIAAGTPLFEVIPLLIVLIVILLSAVSLSAVSPSDSAKKNKKKDDNGSGGGGCGAGSGDGGGCGGCGG